ncbi:MAG: hypothetical protein AAF957_12040 [Planctomycetota bacterium]
MHLQHGTGAGVVPVRGLGVGIALVTLSGAAMAQTRLPPVASADGRVAPRPGGIVLDVMNPPGTSYLDPEIHPERPEMVFQMAGDVWVGALDPGTGLFVSATGQDVFVDRAASLTVARNGPEYGLDRDGTAIFYNRNDVGGRVRIWRATPLGGTFVTEPLTALDGDRINPLVSQDPLAASTYVAYARFGPTPPSSIAWLDEALPAVDNDITPVLPGFAGFRWARGSSLLTSTVAAGLDAGQVVLVDASTGIERVVTDDAGIKFDPFPWFAPEFGGALAVAAIVNGSDIAVYRDTGGPTFDRVALLPVPTGTTMSFAQSHEPFVSGGRSYLSLTLKDDPGSIYTDVTESQIWVYGIEPGPGRFTLRCDDGEAGRIRHEAETMAGTNETFLYYNELLPSGRFDVIRCRTGLSP